MVDFSNNLKQLRQLNNLRQKDLADKLNITLKTISHWETGYTEPSLSQLEMLSNFFNVTIDELVKKM